MEPTKKQVDEYLADGGNHCPLCGSRRISAGQSLWDGAKYSQLVTCKKCGREWWDLYTLTSIKLTEEK